MLKSFDYWQDYVGYKWIWVVIFLFTFGVILVSTVSAEDASLSSVWFDSANLVVSGNVNVSATYEFQFCFPGCVPATLFLSAGGFSNQPFGGFNPLVPNTSYNVSARRQGTPTWSNTVSCRTNRNSPVFACGGDSDSDGFIDAEDACPNEGDKGWGLQSNGCPVPPPDRDSDGVPDHQDRCPDDVGPIQLQGCPDGDGDGIPNIDDGCPDDSGPLSNNGCPLTITNTPNPEDSDGDGVPNSEDRCPNDYGPKDNQGCPYEITTPTPYPNQITNTPTPSPVTTPDPRESCNLAPRPNVGGRNIRVRAEPNENANNTGNVPQAGAGSGPFKVLAISPDGNWYQIGTSVNSIEVYGWIAKSEVQLGGIGGCNTLGDGNSSLTATPLPECIQPNTCITSTPTPTELTEREYNARQVEFYVSDHLNIAFRQCKQRVPDYLNLLSELETVLPDEASALSRRVDNAGEDACDVIRTILEESSSAINTYSIVVCLSRAAHGRVEEIISSANSLGLNGQTFVNLCGVIQNLSVLGIVQGDNEAFYRKLVGQCQQTSETALNVLVYALQQHANLTTIVENGELCFNVIGLIDDPVNQNPPQDKYPRLRICDQNRVAMFMDRIQQEPAPLTEDEIRLILNATNPCQAMRRWMLYGILPEKIVVTLTPSPSPTEEGITTSLPPTQTIEPTQEIASTQAIQTEQTGIESSQEPQNIFNVIWLDEETEGIGTGYTAAFTGLSADEASTDIYTFENEGTETTVEEVEAIEANSPENEFLPSINNKGEIAYIFVSPEGNMGIRELRSNQEISDLIIPIGWSISSDFTKLTWYGKWLYVTLVDAEGNPSVWRYGGTNANESIIGGWNAFVSGDWLVYSMGDINNQYFIPMSDLESVDRGSPLQIPSEMQGCSPFSAFGTNELMAICGTSIYVVKFQGGNSNSTRIFDTDSNSIQNLTRIPYLESYVTWDDGNSIYYCVFKDKRCDPIEFININGGQNTALVWK